MGIGYYTDVHLPLAITEQSRLRGIDMLTAQEDGTSELSDSRLLDRASYLGRILVTQDKDFLGEANLRNRTGGRFIGIVFARQTGVTIGRCVADLELLAKATNLAEWANRLEYLPLK